MTLDYGDETIVHLADGHELRAESYQDNEAGTSYVRIVDPDGEEVAYWIWTEWQEEPEFVMGAIVGAIRAHSTTRTIDAAEAN